MTTLIETMARAIRDHDVACGHDDADFPWQAWKDSLRAALAAIEAAGYRIVPVEAVDEARAALYGAREVLGRVANIQHAIDLLDPAMLAVAPKVTE